MTVIMEDGFNKNTVVIMADFDLWVEDFIEQMGEYKKDTYDLTHFQSTLRLMIQSYYCSLMSKEEFEDIIKDLYECKG